MEIAVPEGCTLKSIYLSASSQEVFDALVAERKAYRYGGENVLTEYVPGDDPDRSYTQESAYFDHDGVHYMIEAPKRYVTVTIADA